MHLPSLVLNKVGTNYKQAKFFESFRDLLKEKEKGFAYLKPSHLSFRFQGSSVQDYIFQLSIR